MQGLSSVCQYPHCAKEAKYCCNRCLKRTYCSEKCQQLDWKVHKLNCVINEDRDEILKEYDALKEEYQSVFKGKREKRKDQVELSKLFKKPKSSMAAKTKEVEVEYNGALLPYCLETVNNEISSFLSLLEQNPLYSAFASKMSNDLLHTSSIDGTTQVMQMILKEIEKKEQNKFVMKSEIQPVPSMIKAIVTQLASYFAFTQLVSQLKETSLYSKSNDYKYVGEERRFCTHCGDRSKLVEHPKLRYVFLCEDCLAEYEENKWEIDDDHEILCCCCGDGGNVVLCDKCNHSVCSNCIMLHLGEEEVGEIEKYSHSGKQFITRVCGNASYARRTRMGFPSLLSALFVLTHVFS